MTNFREIFGRRLRELRKSRLLSQKDLAKIIGRSNNAISLYETAQHEPLFEDLVKISQYFGVSIDYLLELNEKQSPPNDYDTVIYLAQKNKISAETLKIIINEISKYQSPPDLN